MLWHTAKTRSAEQASALKHESCRMAERRTVIRRLQRYKVNAATTGGLYNTYMSCSLLTSSWECVLTKTCGSQKVCKCEKAVVVQLTKCSEQCMCLSTGSTGRASTACIGIREKLQLVYPIPEVVRFSTTQPGGGL